MSLKQNDYEQFLCAKKKIDRYCCAEGYSEELEKFIYFASTQKDLQKCRLLVKSFILSELSCHEFNIHEILLCVLKNSGEPEFMRDCQKVLFPPFLDAEKLLSTIFQSPWCDKICSQKKVIIIINWSFSMIKICFYYIDVIKDIILFHLLLKKIHIDNSFTSFGSQVVFLVFVSIGLPHIIICFCWIYLAASKKVKPLHGILLSSLLFMTPAIALYHVGRLNTKLEIKFDPKTHSKILTWMKRCAFYKLTESVFETAAELLI